VQQKTSQRLVVTRAKSFTGDAAWLGETENGNLKELLVPYPADQMRMWEISPRVSSPKNDDPSLWEPLHAEPSQTTTDAL